MRPTLLAAVLLAGTAAPAAAAWREARTRHFVVYSEQSASELRKYAERLERYDAAVRALRSMDDPPLTEGAKLTIYVLPTVQAVQKLSGRGSGSFNILGFYQGRASGSVAFLSSARLRDGDNGLAADHVFQHEYMHHLMLGDQKTPLLAWLVEGGAEFFGTAKVERDGSVVVGLPPQSRGWSIMEDMGFNAEQLVAGIPAKTAEERESLYGKGWLLSHYLSFAPERAGQLTRYMKAIAGGKRPLDAGREAFGDLRKLDSDIDAYARKSFRALKVSPAPMPEVKVRDLTAGEAAIMPVRLRSDRGVDKETAPAVAGDARRIAAAFPGDVFVQGTLAEAEFDVQDYKAAVAAADRALALDPGNVQALTYKGRALMELGRKDPAKTDWAEVRKWLVRANRADTENAEPLQLFYETFQAAGQKPSPAAVSGLVYAQALAPQDRDLRYMTVRQLLLDGRAAEAGLLFTGIAYDPHLDQSKRPDVAIAMTRMGEGDSKGALVALDEDEKKVKALAEEAAKKSKG